MEANTITETSRLILRRYRKEDLQDLYEYLSDETVLRFEPYKPMTMNKVKENLDWRISTDEMIAAELKSSHKLIGNVYLGKRDFNTLELGYVFNRQYWGQGYAEESCTALIRKAFSEGIHRIYAECDPCNPASWKLLESLGFTREAHFRQNVYFWKDEDNNPIWKDTYVYSLLNEQTFQESGREYKEGKSGQMAGRYKVITLCGSTRFKDAFMETQKRLTLEGNIVISVGLFGHSGDDEVWTEGTKEMLDDMHKRKIDMADEIFVINVGGYIGSSTRSEIEYALASGKKVNYLEQDR